MKKVFLIATFMIAGIMGLKAQEGFKFGGGIRLALPVGTFADSYSFGIGGELQGEYGFSEKFSGIITSGYTSFFGKTVDFGAPIGKIKIPAEGLIPIIVGARVYPSTQFFVGAQVGYGILTGNGSSSGAFEYRPQVGYNGSNVQVALSYDGLSKNGSTLGHIGLTGIYKFGGGSK
ncbi:MAG: hypothetical protein Q8941_18630 [Bacteroidota bacterium]|nr:hypothetical protein [Bacteroidota bacterium]